MVSQLLLVCFSIPPLKSASHFHNIISQFYYCYPRRQKLLKFNFLCDVSATIKDTIYPYIVVIIYHLFEFVKLVFIQGYIYLILAEDQFTFFLSVSFDTTP